MKFLLLSTALMAGCSGCASVHSLSALSCHGYQIGPIYYLDGCTNEFTEDQRTESARPPLHDGTDYGPQ